jgi:hypothetical protein
MDSRAFSGKADSRGEMAAHDIKLPVKSFTSLTSLCGGLVRGEE